MKVIVCGAGQVGFGIARHLAGEGHDVTVVDRSPSLMRRIADTLDVRPVLGHGAHPEVLAEAGAGDADILIAVTASDEVNMVASQIARTLFETPKIIARVRDRHYLASRWQERLFCDAAIPIDVIISPETAVGDMVMRRLAVPGAFDNAAFSDARVQMVGISIGEDCPVTDTPLNQLTGLFPDLRAIVVGLRRDGKTYVPDFSDTIQPGDEAYLITAATDTERTLKIFGHEEHQARRIVIIGGGSIGTQVARALDLQTENYSVTVIEADEDRARDLAETLNRGVVLSGNALSPELLVEAEIADADLVLTLTNDDEVNILATMLALQEGCERGMCIINESTFQPLATRVGMEVVIDPRAITISSILGHVRQGRVLRVHAVAGGAAEVIEAEIGEASELGGQTLRDLDLPDGIRIGAVVRGDAPITPRGSTELKTGDKVTLFAMSDVIETVEKLFRAGRGQA